MLVSAILIVIIILLIYVYLIKFSHPDYSIVLYDDIKDRVKSGDIILFSSSDSFNQIPMISYYTHIGVIYKKDSESEPVLVESFNNHQSFQFYPKEFGSGIAVCDLKVRLDSYRGFVFYKELAKPISEQANKDFAEFIEYAKENMHYDKYVIQNEINKIILNTPFTTETNCGQFTELILMKLNLLEFSHFKSRQKHHLRFVANLTKVKNNRYKTPIYIYQKYFNIPMQLKKN